MHDSKRVPTLVVDVVVVDSAGGGDDEDNRDSFRTVSASLLLRCFPLSQQVSKDTAKPSERRSNLRHHPRRDRFAGVSPKTCQYHHQVAGDAY